MTRVPSLGILYDQEKKGSQVLCETFGKQVQAVVSTILSVPRWTRYLPAAVYSAMLFPRRVPSAFVVSGRRSFHVAHYIKKRHPKCKMIALLDPRALRSSFDLIVAPSHDPIPLTGPYPKVLQTLGGCLGPLPRAKHHYEDTCSVYVMVGGGNRTFTYTTAWVRQLIQHLLPWQNSMVLGISRRTPWGVQQSLQRALPYARCITCQDKHRFYVYNSDSILVTQDSVSMIAEALMSTLASVGIIPVPSRRDTSKFHAFTQDVVTHQGGYMFQGQVYSTPRSVRPKVPPLRQAWQQLWMP